MLFRHSPIRNKRTLAAMLILFFTLLYGAISYSTEIPVVIAQGGSKSSGNELLKAIEGGAELKDMTKQQIIAAYGEPWQKDTTGEKGKVRREVDLQLRDTQRTDICLRFPILHGGPRGGRRKFLTTGVKR